MSSEGKEPRSHAERGGKSDNDSDDKDRDTGHHGDKEDNEHDDDKDKDEDDDKPSIFEKTWVRIAIVAFVVIALIVALIWWLIARQYEDTDDAFIDTHIVHIAPQISGQIIKVAVNDNQLVREGQPLAEINSADAQSRLEQVQAQEAQAETQLHQAEAGEKGAAAQAENADRDLDRYRLLQRTTPAGVAQQQIDQAVATARNAVAQREAQRAQIKGARAQIKALKAQESQANLTLGYTKIVSPITGHIAQRSVALGNYVTPGQEIMAVVPLQLWVTANFKETQLALMRVGQPVDVDVDACGITLQGKVQSIQRGAGQAFGILPPENATGNYVKVVQRVPVKIVLQKLPKDCPLGPGMSVEPSVKVR